MKTFNFFVVKLEKLINDTITMSNGTELYIDSKWDEMGEFNHRVTEGPVVASPFKYDTGVELETPFTSTIWWSCRVVKFLRGMMTITLSSTTRRLSTIKL